MRQQLIWTPSVKLRVLVPGSGLGRLAYDVASLGMFLFP
jgi:hypothetical protein